MTSQPLDFRSPVEDEKNDSRYRADNGETTACYDDCHVVKLGLRYCNDDPYEERKELCDNEDPFTANREHLCSPRHLLSGISIPLPMQVLLANLVLNIHDIVA